MTSLLKFEITVFFWLSLPVHSGSLKRIDISLLLKELIFIFLFVVTAAGVVPCGSLKKRPRTSSIAQFIFYFRSFEISRNILTNQKNIIGLDAYMSLVVRKPVFGVFDQV